MAATLVPRRRAAGFALSLLTAMTWGVVPLTLEQLVRTIDVPTVVWYRFAISAVVLGALLAALRRLPRLGALDRRGALLLAVATLALATNYVAFTHGLELTTPANAQVLIQCAPFLLALGGLALFGERLARPQWLGYAVLLAGQALFLGQRAHGLVEGFQRYWLGTVVILVGAVAWAVYGLAQKGLFAHLAPQAGVLCVYAGAALCTWPLASPSTAAELDALGLVFLAIAGLGTIVGYGAFSEALRCWEASRVGAVLALTPLFTLASSRAAAALWPAHVATEPLNALAVLGACAVVTGSMTASLGGRRRA